MATRKQNAAKRRRARPNAKDVREGKELWTALGADHVYRKPYEDRPGQWRVRRRHLTTGRVGSVSLEAKTLSEAKLETQELADRDRTSAADPETVDASGEKKALSVGEALAGWFETLDARPQTLSSYAADVALYRKVLGAERLVGELAFADVERPFATGAWSTRRGRTKLYHRRRLVLFFQWCMKHGQCRRDLASLVAVPRSWTRSARAGCDRAQALTLKEMKKLLRAAREPDVVEYDGKSHGSEMTGLWLFVFLSLRTGLRISNLLGREPKPALAWKNVDLEKGILSIKAAHMKSDRSYRAPLHREAVAVLRRVRTSLGRIPAPDGPIVQDCPRDVRWALGAALGRAGLRDPESGAFLGELRDEEEPRPLRIHDLRHSCISLWAGEMPGGSYAVLSDHRPADTPNVTGRYDRHQDTESLRRWLDRVPNLIDKNTLRDIDLTISAS